MPLFLFHPLYVFRRVFFRRVYQDFVDFEKEVKIHEKSALSGKISRKYIRKYGVKTV
jgi:hypothetical protein